IPCQAAYANPLVPTRRTPVRSAGSATLVPSGVARALATARLLAGHVVACAARNGAEGALDRGEIVGRNGVKEVAADATEVSRRRIPEPLEPVRGQDRLRPAAVGRARRPFHEA